MLALLYGASYHACIKRKHKILLTDLFTNPVRVTLAWSDIEALLVALGCRVIEGSGSRVKFVSGQQILAVHRPHPRKEAKPYQVRAVREFLKQLGVTP